MARIFGALVIASICANFAAPADAAVPFVVGSWYGQGQPADKYEMWLDHLLPDGSFNGLYRSCVKGKAYDATQTGYWSLKDNMLSISIVTVNGFFQPRVDVYQTLSQDPKHWSYRYLKLGYVFNAERVDNKYQITPCETVS
jgi:hypothetical protein